MSSRDSAALSRRLDLIDAEVAWCSGRDCGLHEVPTTDRPVNPASDVAAFVATVERDDRLETQRAIRDAVAYRLALTTSARDIAALARRLLDIDHAIHYSVAVAARPRRGPDSDSAGIAAELVEIAKVHYALARDGSELAEASRMLCENAAFHNEISERHKQRRSS